MKAKPAHIEQKSNDINEFQNMNAKGCKKPNRLSGSNKPKMPIRKGPKDDDNQVDEKVYDEVYSQLTPPIQTN